MMFKKYLVLLFCCLLSAAALSGCRTVATPMDEISYLTPIPDDKTWYTQVEAREVLKQLSDYLHKHHALFLMEKERVSEIENAYLNAWDAVPKNGMNKIQLIRAARRLLNPFHDAHLAVWPMLPKSNQNIILTDLVIREVRGAKLKSVNGETIEDIFNRTEDWHVYELTEGAMNEIRNQLNTEFGFVLYGFNPAELTVTLENPDGSESTVQYTKSDFHDLPSYLSIIRKELTDELINRKTAPYKFEMDDAKKAIILTLNSCDYEDAYISMLQQMFSDAAQKNIEYIIVDLRNNKGGNSLVANEFIKYLNVDVYKEYTTYVRNGEQLEVYTDDEFKNHKKKDIFNGKIYILTSVKTFSSAVIFAELIQANHLGTIVGEVPGNLVNTYGDVLSKEMENYPFMMRTTFKYFVRASGDMNQKMLIPDIQCSADEAMQKVYSDIERVNNKKAEEIEKAKYSAIDHHQDVEE